VAILTGGIETGNRDEVLNWLWNTDDQNITDAVCSVYGTGSDETLAAMASRSSHYTMR
jgi:hypothetical protein